MRRDISAVALRQVLDYDQATGIFRWKVRPARNVFAGDIAGTIGSRGYRIIRVLGVRFSAHRLAWLHVHGKLPEGILDHINRDKDDNRISNLRQAGHELNAWNRPPAANSIATGVCLGKGGNPFRVRVSCNGQRRTVGFYATAEEAAAAYANAKANLYQEIAK